MSKVLDGKVALVTGGSRGIGAATALRLADDGANVAISHNASPDRAEAVVEQLKSKGVRAAAFKADQGKPDQARRLIREVVGEFGGLDILVNNAAIIVVAPIDDASIDVAQLDRQHAVNFTGIVAGVREAINHMGDGGRIINIGSVAGSRVGFPGMTDYAATKAALAGRDRRRRRVPGAPGLDIRHRHRPQRRRRAQRMSTFQPSSEQIEVTANGLTLAALTQGLADGRLGVVNWLDEVLP